MEKLSLNKFTQAISIQHNNNRQNCDFFRKPLRFYSIKQTLLSFIVLVILGSCSSINKPAQQTLNNNWTLFVDSINTEINAIVPGFVHTDLLAAGLIVDPFVGKVESDLQWIGQRDWEYKLHFTPNAQLFEKDHIQLRYNGLDTYAKVSLNNQELFQSDNMFRSYEIDVKTQLVKGDNILIIKFYAPDSIIQAKAASYPFQFPDERAFARKAPYQFGWDWGPKYVTMGIWKDVELVAWNNFRLKNTAIHQLAIDSSIARLELKLELESNKNKTLSIRIKQEGILLKNKKFEVQSGENNLSVPFEIENPKLWWPNGMGDQNMYIIDIQIFDKNTLVDEKQVKIGLRTIELVQEPDEIGTTFYFKVNGIPVFMKGANYIPEDNFPSRTPIEKTKKLLSDAAAVHMNMIRVWGGGVYPSDDFYDLCDSLGLLVWQDFMFACTMYPFDSAFLDNVKFEATEQVKRLHNHPSLALWCGNNEVSEGFHNWGWQQSLDWTTETEKEIWKGYQQLFDTLLVEIVKQNDAQSIYWPSSPSKGWGRAESLTQGDVHYWGVWWGEEPFEMYEKKLGRFHSEYGFQGMPNIASVNQFTSVSERHLGSDELEAHQKHPRGSFLIDMYMKRDFPVPEQLNEYIYVSQLLQSYGISKAIEAQRRNHPITMGTLYWQLNDCWPVTSWSSIDYYGRWKALHYHLKSIYAPLLLSVEEKNDTLNLFLVNDKTTSIQARLEVDLKAMDGSVLRSYTEPIETEGNKSRIIKSFSLPILLSGIERSTVFLHSRIMENEQLIVEKFSFFVNPKNLKLKQDAVVLSIENEANRVKIQLSSRVLIKNLMLSCNDSIGFFSDNYFDLVPNRQMTIYFYPSDPIHQKDLKFDLLMLNDLNYKTR